MKYEYYSQYTKYLENFNKKLLEKKEKDENCNDVSDTIEFIEYGLYLAFYEADLAKAKSEFALFEENGEYDTGEETIKSLMEKFKASFG